MLLSRKLFSQNLSSWRRRLKIPQHQGSPEAHLSTTPANFAVIQVEVDNELEKKVSAAEIKVNNCCKHFHNLYPPSS